MPIARRLSFATALFVHRHTPEFPGKWRIGRFLNRAAPTVRLPDEAVLRSPYGFRISLKPSDFLQRQIYLSRQWEPHVCRAMRSLLRPGDVFIDVGANIGYLSLVGARLVGSRGRVLAFEPNPGCADQLTANLGLNGTTNVAVYPYCLGDRRTSASFFPDCGRNAGASSIIRQPHSGRPIDVTMEPLDDVIQRESIPRVALVKIDVEGGELGVLQGARGLLSRPDGPAVICEISEWSLSRLGVSREAIFAMMASAGYGLQILSNIGRSINSEDSVYFQYDVLFRKKTVP